MAKTPIRLMTLSLVLLGIALSAVDAEAARKGRRANPRKEAARNIDNALVAQKDGRLPAAIRNYELVQKKFSKIPLNDEHDSDVATYGPRGIANYGEYAEVLLKFARRELNEGEVRRFMDTDSAVSALRSALEEKNPESLAKVLWVRVQLDKCEESDSVEPEPAADYVNQQGHLKASGVSIKVIDGSDPSVELQKNDRNLARFQLTKLNDHWMWNQITESCDQ